MGSLMTIILCSLFLFYFSFNKKYSYLSIVTCSCRIPLFISTESFMIQKETKKRLIFKNMRVNVRQTVKSNVRQWFFTTYSNISSISLNIFSFSHNSSFSFNIYILLMERIVIQRKLLTMRKILSVYVLLDVYPRKINRSCVWFTYNFS